MWRKERDLYENLEANKSKIMFENRFWERDILLHSFNHKEYIQTKKKEEEKKRKDPLSHLYLYSRNFILYLISII